jgi:chemotaxis signal transduction protein
MSASVSLGNISGLLIFQIAEKEFCTDLKPVTAIMKPGEIKFHTRGLRHTNVDPDQKYTAIDFAGFYSLKNEKSIDSSRVLYLELFGQKISFNVDKVMEIISLDKLFIEESIRMELADKLDYVDYILSIKQNKYYFPDFARIVREMRFMSVL